MRKLLTAALLLAAAGPIAAGKPGPGGSSPPPNPEVGYRLLSGKSVKLMVANADATNAVSLYSSPTSFRFDLGPRARQQIAITNGSGSASRLYLLNYTTSGSGTLAPGTLQDLGPSRQGSNIDFSPDGTKIAYVCCFDGTNETLAVYDLTNGSITHWATGPYFWDFAWFRNGTSIAYSTHNPARLYELAAPGGTPELLYSGQGEINVDAYRNNPGLLVVSYNDSTGDARIGSFDASAKQFVNADLANSARSWQGTLDCNDGRLAFMGVQNTSGSQAFYIRDLTTGLNSLFSKSSNILLQFFPTCS